MITGIDESRSAGMRTGYTTWSLADTADDAVLAATGVVAEEAAVVADPVVALLPVAVSESVALPPPW
jgi:hypothetical protein